MLPTHFTPAPPAPRTPGHARAGGRLPQFPAVAR